MDTPTSDTPCFDAPDLARIVESMSTSQIDALPFGCIRVQPNGTVGFYSRREAELSGMGERPALGEDFFRRIAPCMDSPLVRGRIEAALAAGSLDVRMRHVGDFARRSRVLDLRAVSAGTGGFWLFVNRS